MPYSNYSDPYIEQHLHLCTQVCLVFHCGSRAVAGELASILQRGPLEGPLDVPDKSSLV